MPDDPKPARSRRRVWPWLVGAFLLVVLLPPLLVLVHFVRAASQVDVENARIRAAGEPVTPAELEEFYAPPPADQDVTQLWIAATAPLDAPAFAEAAKDLPLVGQSDEEIPAPGEPWADLEAAEALLAKYDGSLALLHEAAERGGAARFPTDFSAGISMPMPEVQALRRGARMLALEAHVRAHRGDTSGAARSIHALLRLARSLDQQPLLISFLVRVAVDGMAAELVRNFLPHVRLTDEELAKSQAELRSVRYAPGLKRALIGERVIVQAVFEDPSAVDGPKIAPGNPYRLVMRADQAYYQIMMARLIATCDRPWPEVIREANALDQELQSLTSNKMKSLPHIMTLLLMPALNAAVQAAARGEATNVGTDVAIAVERFRRQHGDLPRDLGELVPEFLPEVPLDPFDGQPLRYVVREGEYAIYSIGPDGMDDGGQGDQHGKPDVVLSVKLR